MVKPNWFRFYIDRGGIFTEIYAEFPDEPGFKILKLLSENSQQYPDAPLEGIRQIIHEVTGKLNIPNELIKWVRLGTTLATNAFLERKGTKSALFNYKIFWRFTQNRKTKPASYFWIKYWKTFSPLWKCYRNWWKSSNSLFWWIRSVAMSGSISRVFRAGCLWLILLHR